MAGKYGAAQYLLEDQPRTLFPLTLTRILVEQAETALYTEIDRILKTDPKKENTGFLTQINCHAAKRGLHSRRTLKLDPVAELFVYDLAYRERATFRPSPTPDRKRFGYIFRGGRPTPATTSYGEFREAARRAASRFKCHLGVDIASYFNSKYILQQATRDLRTHNAAGVHEKSHRALAPRDAGRQAVVSQELLH